MWQWSSYMLHCFWNWKFKDYCKISATKKCCKVTFDFVLWLFIYVLSRAIWNSSYRYRFLTRLNVKRTMFRKKRKFLEILFFLLLSVFFVMYFFLSNHLYCLKTVENVNLQLETIGLNRKCLKQKLQTAESCNSFQV